MSSLGEWKFSTLVEKRAETCDDEVKKRGKSIKWIFSHFFFRLVPLLSLLWGKTGRSSSSSEVAQGKEKKFTEESSYRQLAISYTDRLLFCFHFTPLSFVVGIVWGFPPFWALLAAIFLPALNLFHLKFSILSKYHHHHHLCRLIFNTVSLSLPFPLLSQEVQVLKALVLGEEERGQSQYQVMCFLTKLQKGDFISSDAMAKLRQVRTEYTYTDIFPLCLNIVVICCGGDEKMTVVKLRNSIDAGSWTRSWLWQQKEEDIRGMECCLIPFHNSCAYCQNNQQ